MKKANRILVAGVALLAFAAVSWFFISRRGDQVGTQGPAKIAESSHLITGTLAPDGSRVLLLNATSSGRRVLVNLDEYRLGQSKQTETLDLSTGVESTDGSNWPAPAALRFCDGGRSLLIYAGSGTFLVLDATSMHTVHSLRVPVGAAGGGPNSILAGGCAASAPIAAIYSTGTGSANLSIFDMQSGQQIKNIAGKVRTDHFSSLDVSPSGAKAAILFLSLPNDAPPRPDRDLTVFDLNAGSVAANIQTGMTGQQVVFVGEGAVAVGSGTIRGSSANKTVQLFRLDTGQVARSFGASPAVAGAPMGASADGKFLMTYTGEEALKQDALQIERAQFTIWNAASGAVVARSPPLRVSTKSTAGWDLAPASSVPRDSIRPVMAFSQGGNAVLVSHPVYGGPVETFRVTPAPQ